jgi:hypothetical protein
MNLSKKWMLIIVLVVVLALAGLYFGGYLTF